MTSTRKTRRIATPFLLVVTLLSFPQFWAKPPIGIAVGFELFTRRCTNCHGQDAAGDGPRHSEFIPPPANLTLVRDAPKMMVSIIRKGIQGTTMPSYPHLSDAQIGSIIAYIRSRPLDTGYQWDYAWGLRGAPPPPLMGSRIYVTTCSGCHGAAGDGWAVYAMADPHFWPKPANFRGRNSDVGRTYQTITDGRPGTMMPPQRLKLSEPARWALALQVTAMLNPRSTATIPTGPLKLYVNPFNPRNRSVVAQGKDMNDLYCSPCHGEQARGLPLAPRLTDRLWLYGGGTDNSVFMVVTKGIPGKVMLSFRRLAEKERWAVVTYLRSRGGLPDPIALVSRAAGR